MEHFKVPNLDVVREKIHASVSRAPSSGLASTPTLDPMDRQMATKLVRRLLAGYPNLNAHDPEMYVAVLVQVMSGYPQWAGERSILRVDAENSKFPPTEKVLRGWLEETVAPFRFRTEWEARSRAQIASRLPEDTPKQFSGTIGDGSPGTTYTNFDEATEKHGRPFGPFESGRERSYRG